MKALVKLDYKLNGLEKKISRTDELELMLPDYYKEKGIWSSSSRTTFSIEDLEEIKGIISTLQNKKPYEHVVDISKNIVDVVRDYKISTQDKNSIISSKSLRIQDKQDKYAIIEHKFHKKSISESILGEKTEFIKPCQEFYVVDFEKEKILGELGQVGTSVIAIPVSYRDKVSTNEWLDKIFDVDLNKSDSTAPHFIVKGKKLCLGHIDSGILKTYSLDKGVVEEKSIVVDSIYKSIDQVMNYKAAISDLDLSAIKTLGNEAQWVKSIYVDKIIDNGAICFQKGVWDCTQPKLYLKDKGALHLPAIEFSKEYSYDDFKIKDLFANKKDDILQISGSVVKNPKEQEASFEYAIKMYE